jgi:cytochrome c-type biogenesis protein CcmE
MMEGNQTRRDSAAPAPKRTRSPAKFLIGGGLIVAAIIYLIASSTTAAAQYYLTIDELHAKGEAARDRALKIAGAVDGESIRYDAKTLTLRFTMANVPADMDEIERAGGLAEALHQAVSNPSARRLEVIYVGPKPDLLRHEAQAIVTGTLGPDGVLYADELLLKCPTRYEEEVPLQAVES